MTNFPPALYGEAVGVAKAAARPYRKFVDADEAESVACVLMAQAVRDYRSDRGVSLRDYVRCRVRNGVKSVVRRECRRDRTLTRQPAEALRSVPARAQPSEEIDGLKQMAKRATSFGWRAIQVAVGMIRNGDDPTQADVVRALRAQGLSWTAVERALEQARKAVGG